MRALQHAAALVVPRNDAEPGRVSRRLVCALEPNTFSLLDEEPARASLQSPPSVIDISELRFLDLIGLRALLRAGQREAASTVRLVGATAIVRRLIALTRTFDSERQWRDDRAFGPLAGDRVGAEPHDAVCEAVAVNSTRSALAPPEAGAQE